MTTYARVICIDDVLYQGIGLERHHVRDVWSRLLEVSLTVTLCNHYPLSDCSTWAELTKRRDSIAMSSMLIHPTSACGQRGSFAVSLFHVVRLLKRSFAEAA